VNLDLYPIGWLHTAFSILALAAGAVVLVRPKGTPVHKLRGRIYVLALIATCLTSFAIYRLGKFWFPHWFGVAALMVVVAGFALAHWKVPRRAWMHLHLTCMIASYYMLIGGGVNEVFLRIGALRRIAPDVLNSSVVGLTHFTVMLLFAILIGYFNAALLLRRPRPAQ
jgi:uncharacterized membrane protein